MLVVCIRMLLVCYSCVSRMYSYVFVCIRMFRMLLVCYPYVLVWCCSHDRELELIKFEFGRFYCNTSTTERTKTGVSSKYNHYCDLKIGAKTNPTLDLINKCLWISCG